MLLQTDLGASRVLGRPDSRRLWVLNPLAAALWDLHASGLDAAALADLLAAQFSLEALHAGRQVTQLLVD